MSSNSEFESMSMIMKQKLLDAVRKTQTLKDSNEKTAKDGITMVNNLEKYGLLDKLCEPDIIYLYNKGYTRETGKTYASSTLNKKKAKLSNILSGLDDDSRILSLSTFLDSPLGDKRLKMKTKRDLQDNRERMLEFFQKDIVDPLKGEIRQIVKSNAEKGLTLTARQDENAILLETVLEKFEELQPVLDCTLNNIPKKYSNRQLYDAQFWVAVRIMLGSDKVFRGDIGDIVLDFAEDEENMNKKDNVVLHVHQRLITIKMARKTKRPGQIKITDDETWKYVEKLIKIRVHFDQDTLFRQSRDGLAFAEKNFTYQFLMHISKHFEGKTVGITNIRTAIGAFISEEGEAVEKAHDELVQRKESMDHTDATHNRQYAYAEKRKQLLAEREEKKRMKLAQMEPETESS